MKKPLFFILLLVSSFTFSNEWQDQKASFQEKGYLWIKNFFSKEQVLLLQNWTETIYSDAQTLINLPENKRPSGALIVVPEAKNRTQVCRTEDMLSLYPELYHFIQGTITSYLTHLFGEPYVLFKDKLNFKWPGGGAFTPHQDFPAFELFGPREHITAMVCIDAATIQNGCLYIAEDWKKDFENDPSIDGKMLQEGSVVLPYVIGGKDHGSIQPQYAKKVTWLPLKTSPGDLVIFTSFVPHYSEINNSTSPRRAMFFTLNKLSEGEHRIAYYHTKRADPHNPVFHFATPTKARSK